MEGGREGGEPHHLLLPWQARQSILQQSVKLIAKAMSASEALVPPKTNPAADLCVLTTPIIAARDVRSSRNATTPQSMLHAEVVWETVTDFLEEIGIVETTVLHTISVRNWRVA